MLYFFQEYLSGCPVCIRYLRGTRSVQLAFFTPETPGRVIYTLYVMSDSYLGLDQQYEVCLDVTEASIEAQVCRVIRPVVLLSENVRYTVNVQNIKTLNAMLYKT